MKFYERFKMLCEEIGKSPTGVGKEVGASNAAVNYWKEGHTPKHETLAKIADYFNVSINYLVGESDNRKSGVINGDDIAKVALFGGDSDVTDEMWDEVKRYAEYIKASKAKKSE